MSDTVKLGYALEGTHDQVDIPIRHMVVAGQTQEAGKTTTLEALIERSGKTAIAFVTKRGEGSFAGGLRGRLAILISKGFFDNATTANAAFSELKRSGFGVAVPSVYRECDKLAELGFLTKEDGGYQAVPDMKINLVRA